MPDQAPISPFDQLIGTEWLEIAPEQARARIAIEERHTQPYGLVHGGVFATLAESICSRATHDSVRDQGQVAVGLSNATSFMRPMRKGHVNALARRRHAGRTTWIWDVELSDDEGRVCALVRMTIAIREA
jgi:1,4-dihydroxy-2-naphthoyl-CoA hydrolase